SDALARELKAPVLAFDVRDRVAAQQVLDGDVRTNGAYYGVVLNAGVARDNAFPALGDDDWDEVLDTSLGGFYNVLKPLVMPMVRAKQGGRIVVLGSVSGVVGNRGQVNYSAAKAGLIGAAKALANAWRGVEGRRRALKNAVQRMPEWDRHGELLHTRLAAPIAGFEPQAHYPRKMTRSMGRVSLLALRATELALEQAGL